MRLISETSIKLSLWPLNQKLVTSGGIQMIKNCQLVLTSVIFGNFLYSQMKHKQKKFLFLNISNSMESTLYQQLLKVEQKVFTVLANKIKKSLKLITKKSSEQKKSLKERKLLVKKLMLKTLNSKKCKLELTSNNQYSPTQRDIYSKV